MTDCRPSARLHKTVDVNSKFALSLPDLSFLHPFNDEFKTPVYCVEIKPKIGFLPTSPWILAEEEVKKDVCYYCRLQHLKIKEGTWSEISKYCPIDLFSGHPVRMKYALNQLLENPQNNLRIFKNGELLYGAQGKSKPTIDDQINLHQELDTYFSAAIEEEKTVDEGALKRPAVQSFLDVVLKALLHSKEEKSPLQVKSSLPNQTCKASGFTKTSLRDSKSGNQKVRMLPEGSALDVILQVQRLDDLDIEGVYAMYQKHQNMISATDDTSSEEGKQLDWPYEERKFLQRVLSSEEPVITQDAKSVTLDDAVHKIRTFLLAGTAKDCSVLLAIQPEGTTDRSWNYPYTCHHGNKTYLYSSHIIDLDTKPSSRIPKYYKLNKKLVKVYNSL
ncbi:inositol-pentakisphosphate 2-kinase-like [Amphiura filiformis]|uniref:inositol-pentakisphosphate 2-kinase-like n=1 Tax=Amphiura filiformis TaxID=82378 RepID=UPI003B21BFEA